jgi:hypothetical protein
MSKHHATWKLQKVLLWASAVLADERAKVEILGRPDRASVDR